MRKVIVLVCLFVVLTACSEVKVPELSPEVILEQSVERMREIEGFHFLVVRDGEHAFLDPEETISFRRADGDYVVPDKVFATVKVIAPGIVAEVKIISIGDNHWETNILSGKWQVIPPKYAFQPAILFDPASGMQDVLANDLKELEYLGIVEIEEMPGFSLYHIAGRVSGTHINQITEGLIDAEELAIELWIAPKTFELYRVIMVDPMDEGEEEDTVWQIDFWDFDQIIDIQPPIN